MKRANFPHEAVAAIDDILQYGATKHEPGSWRNESSKHHTEKAKGHINDWLYGVDRDEDHLACALTRMAMAIAVREQEQKEDSDK